MSLKLVEMKVEQMPESWSIKYLKGTKKNTRRTIVPNLKAKMKDFDSISQNLDTLRNLKKLGFDDSNLRDQKWLEEEMKDEDGGEYEPT